MFRFLGKACSDTYQPKLENCFLAQRYQNIVRYIRVFKGEATGGPSGLRRLYHIRGGGGGAGMVLFGWSGLTLNPKP